MLRPNRVVGEENPRSHDNNKIVVESEGGVSLFSTAVLLKAVVRLVSLSFHLMLDQSERREKPTQSRQQ
jgi:hypothetical protein